MNLSSEEVGIANLASGAHFAKTLQKLGLKRVFFSPGSRSTSLIIGLERYSDIEIIPVLDERTAAFLALGNSKRENSPTGLICTSGSALAHWFPAVTEACHASVPLLLFSADRPPELQECAAGQTINQKNIFGEFVRGFHQLVPPSSSEDSAEELIQTLQLAYQQATGINPGPVHLNFPFREPFLPNSADIEIPATEEQKQVPKAQKFTYPDSPQKIAAEVSLFKKPVLVTGQFITLESLQPWLDNFSLPILCDSLSPARHSASSNTISRYENLLRDLHFTEKAIPDLIIVLGPLPTSKTLRRWIDESEAKRIVIEPRGINVGPLSRNSDQCQLAYEHISELTVPQSPPSWIKLWQEAEESVDFQLEATFSTELPSFEGKLAHLLSLHLPSLSDLFVANSMPMRDIEWFWKQVPSERRLFGNRGVNGIDGTLGTALGIAHESNRPAYLLSGDLAFLHDSNALLFSKQLKGSLTVFVINNFGGGIFEHLPIADEPEFEKCFATPQNIDLQDLCKAFKVSHEQLTSWTEIILRIKHPKKFGIHIIEIRTDRKKDRILRQKLLSISPQDYA